MDKKWLAGILGLSALIAVIFQNCGEFKTQVFNSGLSGGGIEALHPVAALNDPGIPMDYSCSKGYCWKVEGQYFDATETTILGWICKVGSSLPVSLKGSFPDLSHSRMATFATVSTGTISTQFQRPDLDSICNASGGATPFGVGFKISNSALKQRNQTPGSFLNLFTMVVDASPSPGVSFHIPSQACGGRAPDLSDANWMATCYNAAPALIYPPGYAVNEISKVGPSVPSNFLAKAVSYSKIELSWGPSSDDVGVVGYRIYRTNPGGASSAEVVFGSFESIASDAGLAAENQYCYQVAAIDTDGLISARTNKICATTPAAFNGATASLVAVPANPLVGDQQLHGRTTLYWNAPGVSSVKVIVALVGGISVASGGSTGKVNISDVPNGTPYQLVSQSDGAVLATYKAEVVPDKNPPTIPQNLKAVAVSPTKIDVSWTPSTDDVEVKYYQIYRRPNPSLFHPTSKGTSPSYADSNLNPATEYCYSVAAQDEVGNLSMASSEVCVKTPLAPVNCAALSVNSSIYPNDTIHYAFPGIVLSATDTIAWSGTKNGTVDETRFQYGPNADHYDLVMEADLSAIVGTYTRFYEILDSDKKPLCKSNTVTLTIYAKPPVTGPVTPTNLKVTATSSTEVNLTWDVSTSNVLFGAVYKISRTTNGAAAVQLNGNTVNVYKDSGLNASTQYCYTVAADRASGGSMSAPSQEVCVTTPKAAAQLPTLKSAGYGCGDNYCLWILGENLTNAVSVVVTQQSGVKTTYSSGEVILDSSTQAITLRLKGGDLVQFFDKSLDVSINNLDAGGSVIGSSAKFTVTPPERNCAFLAATHDVFPGDYLEYRLGGNTRYSANDSIVWSGTKDETKDETRKSYGPYATNYRLGPLAEDSPLAGTYTRYYEILDGSQTLQCRSNPVTVIIHRTAPVN